MQVWRVLLGHQVPQPVLGATALGPRPLRVTQAGQQGGAEGWNSTSSVDPLEAGPQTKMCIQVYTHACTCLCVCVHCVCPPQCPPLSLPGCEVLQGPTLSMR